MKDILKPIETPYIDAQTLLNLLADYRNLENVFCAW